MNTSEVDRFGTAPGVAGGDAIGEASRRRSRRRIWPWLVGVPLLTILAGVLAVGLVVLRNVSGRLAAATAAADRDDRFWRIDDLMAHRAAVPDSENSARVVAEALADLPENWPGSPQPPPGVPLPPPTAASQAFDRLAHAPFNARLADADVATLRAELERYPNAVRIGRTVANYDRGRHELKLGPTLIDTLLPETQAARSLARLLAADAAIRAHDGDLDGALDSCRGIVATARSIGDEPFAISQLVRQAIDSVAMNSVRRVLGQGEPSEAALARMQDLIVDEMHQPLTFYAMRGERAILYELIRRVGKGEIPISALSGQVTKQATNPGRNAIAPWGKLWFDQQRAVGLEWMNEAVAIARQPVAARAPLWAAWEARNEKTRRSRLGVFGAMLPLLMAPAISTVDRSYARIHGELGSAAILVAAERHRRKSGDWPASIAAIDPRIMPTAPVDPYSGQPYHMERRDGQLLIYSVGPNHKDEHGAYDLKKWARGGPDDVGAGGWDVPLRRQPSREAER